MNTAAGLSRALTTDRGRFSGYLDERAETLPRADIERLQESRLRHMLDWACANVPLIRETWQKAGVSPADIRSIADFHEKAPFTSKDTIREFRDRHGDPFGGLNGVRPFDLKGVTFTSGTTGDPTPVLKGQRATAELCTMRDIWMIGGRPGDYITVIRPTFRVGHTGEYFQQIGFIPILFKHHPSILDDLVRAVDEFQPSLHMYLSNPLLIAMEEYFERSGKDPVAVFRHCRGATVGGEPLSPRLQALVSGWGLELFGMGGLGESITMVDCSAHDGMHAWEDHVLVECLDTRDDSPVADGDVGELVVTVLTEPFQPMIRYRTDDLVTLNRERCSCGRTHARVKIVGRRSDQILVCGKAILPRDLQLAIEGERATRAGLYQIIRSAPEMDSLRVRIGYDETVDSGARKSLAERLGDAIGKATGVPVDIEMTPNAELLKLGPPHKIPRVAQA